MENNQEHKIDKIFKKSLENQPIIPPTDAWMGIHTYTIGQEEKKPKVWLKYAYLAMLLLVVSGFGLWYFVDNQIFVRRDILKLHSYEVVSEDTDHGEKNAGRVQNPASVKKGKTLSSIVVISPTSSLIRKQTLQNQNTISSHSKQISISLTPQVNLLGEKPRDEALLSYEMLVENNNNIVNLTEDKLEIIKPKPLILNDLINIIQKGNESKIVTLEENIIDKKGVSKVDLIDYGGKFSLRHPIISFGIGKTINFWKMNQYFSGSSSFFKQSNYLYYKENDEAQMEIGISWRLSKKARFGFIISSNEITLKIPFVPQPIWSSSQGFGQPTANLIEINSANFYQSKTVFGNVNIPISYFKGLPTIIPNKLDNIRDIVPFGSHTMTISSLALTSQYDIISKNRKKGKRYGYQLYGLMDFQIQKQTGYLYSSYNSVFSSSSLNPPIPLKFSLELHHLENASEFVFGLRTGLGFRYQFARKWDFFIEGSGQHSLNNWVKSDDIKTYQRALSLQAGINVNL